MARRLIDTSLQLLLLLTCVSLFDAMYILVLPQCWPAGKEERELSTGCCAVLIFLSLSLRVCVGEREREWKPWTRWLPAVSMGDFAFYLFIGNRHSDIQKT